MRLKAELANIGAVTALGPNWAATWSALLQGKRAIAARANGPAAELLMPVAAVETSGDSSHGPAQLARLAAGEALVGETRPVRLYGGTNHGDAEVLVHAVAGDGDDWSGLLKDRIPEHIAPSGAETWIYSACSTGLHALALAALDVEAEEALDEDSYLVVCVDVLSTIGMVGFSRLGAVSQRGCLPFHEARDGLTIGEAACAVRLQRPRDRSRAICVRGAGMSCDASHPTQPDPSGVYLEAAFRDAIRNAGYQPGDIAGAVLHGTGTEANDRIEAEVCGRIWGPGAIPVTSIKGALGHTMGAAGLLNAAVAAQTCMTGLMPPTVSDGSALIPDLDVVRNAPRLLSAGRPILTAAAGFGGNNIAMVIGSLL